jgi:hypothetical protein
MVGVALRKSTHVRCTETHTKIKSNTDYTHETN